MWGQEPFCARQAGCHQIVCAHNLSLRTLPTPKTGPPHLLWVVIHKSSILHSSSVKRNLTLSAKIGDFRRRIWGQGQTCQIVSYSYPLNKQTHPKLKLVHTYTQILKGSQGRLTSKTSLITSQTSDGSSWPANDDILSSYATTMVFHDWFLGFL